MRKVSDSESLAGGGKKMDNTQIVQTKEGVLELTGDPNNVWHLAAWCTVLVDGVGPLLEGEDPLLRHQGVVQRYIDPEDQRRLMPRLENRLAEQYQQPGQIPDRLLRVIENTMVDFGTYTATYKRRARRSGNTFFVGERSRR